MTALKPAEILAPIADDMAQVNQLIRTRLSSDVVLINQLGEHIISSGGKRLRPAMAVLAAKAAGGGGERAHLLAAVIEFIHTATLLHDDVVDHSELRRGEATANALWGNEASVLTGDFLYSRAFQLMMELQDSRVLQVLADTTNRIAEGEVLQLMNCHNPDISEAIYDEVIERKTAVLFEAAARCGGLISGLDDHGCQALAAYGHHLGMAFQLVDDCLDYTSDADTLGKNLGDDLAEGKTTLPLIRAMEQSDAESKGKLSNAIKNGDAGQLDQVIKAIEATDAIAYTSRRAETAAQAAIQSLDALPDSNFLNSMKQLAEFSAQRPY